MSRSPTDQRLQPTPRDPVALLEREWATLAAGPLARRLPAWAARQPPLRRFTAATEVIRFFRLPAPTSAKNEALAALLALAREEPLAARVVLEALLPGLKAIAKPLLLEVEREQLWSLLLTGLWEQIVRYPAARPRRAVALYLLSNTRRAAVRTLARERRRAPQQLPLLPLAPAPPGPTSDIDGVLAAAAAAGAISSAGGELIAATRIDRTPLAALADHLGVSYDALRMRRARAERRLALFLATGDVRNGPGDGPFSSARIAAAPAAARAAPPVEIPKEERR